MKRSDTSLHLNNSKGFISVLLVGVVLVILFLIGAGIFFYKDKIDFKLKGSVEEPKQEMSDQKVSGPLSFEPLPEIEFKSIPVTINKKLGLVPLPQYGKEVIVTQIEHGGTGGASYYGSSGPEVSPDLKQTAFIEAGVLGLISADGKHIVKVPDLKVEYISGWSPNSEKLMVYSPKQSLEDIYMGYGIAYEKKYDPNKLPGGFYVINVKKGSVDFIEPLNTFEEWIGNDWVLSVVSLPRSGQAAEEHYIVFDLNTFTADAKLLEDKFKDYFGKQFSFNADGKRWAISLGNTEGSPGGSFSEVQFGNFPDINGEILDRGTWAEVQSPIISPNGQRVIYVFHGGGTIWQTMLWDGQNKKHLTSGRPYMWINNDQFLMERFESGQDEPITRIFIYDITTGKEQQIY